MSDSRPLVSFVVPCYKLAHLLRECVDSILGQTYQHLEVLIMDDCSPDDTPAVAATYTDRRVRYVRNDPNLGHLRNYQKGIELARGELLWLISADDRLRRPYAVERFVAAFEANPAASFVFCPSVRFEDDRELDVYGAHGSEDRVFRRPEFLRTLLNGNSVSAPAACARKAYYDRIGGFPLDLPFAGDWYVWARFALEGDVVYLHEPMVGYRFHALNMTKSFTTSRMQALVRDEVEIAWRILRDAQAGKDNVSASWALEAVAADYSRRAAAHIQARSSVGLSPVQVESNVRAHRPTANEYCFVRGRVQGAVGDALWDAGDLPSARHAYAEALRHQRTARVAAKYLLACSGRAGQAVRAGLIRARQLLRHKGSSAVRA